jgi:hypothetical protein
MGVKIDQDSEVGEYDSAMQTLLQLMNAHIRAL